MLSDKENSFECFLCKFKCSKRHYYQNHLIKEHNLDVKLNTLEKNLDNFKTKKEFDIKRRVNKIIRKINNPCIFFDIGSSDGLFTEQILKKRENSVFYLFEPFQLDYKKSLEKFEKNNNVLIHNFGLSDRVDKKKLYNFYGNKNFGLKTTSKKFLSRKKSNVIEENIICVTLDKFCSYNKIDSIDFLKIDTDGTENLVLDGFMETLKKLNKKPYILLKLKWGSKHPEWESYKKVFDKLIDIGYLGFNYDRVRADSYLLIEPSKIKM